MSASVSPASNNISKVVDKLRRLSQLEVQPGWRYCDSVSALGIFNKPIAELNGKGHIAWPAGKQIVYLGQQFVIPDNLYGYPIIGLRLLLSLTWWAEDAQIFVNGELVGQGDLFDCADRVLLSSSVNPGDEFLVVLRLVSPGHDCGALVRSVCLYEAADSACFDPGFVAAELEILQNSLSGNLVNLNSQYLPTEIIDDRAILVKGEMLKSGIDLALNSIDWSVVCDREKFDRSLSVLRHNLLGYLRAFSANLDDGTAEDTEGTERKRKDEVLEVGESGSITSIYIGESGKLKSIYKGKIYLVGHAHLDLAWLWPVPETWEAAERTFESVLKLRSEFPDLIFCHSTPALYAWMEEHRPDLFAEIKKQVAVGGWEVIGGMWVEPDLNLICAESMVRQVFYGQRYAQEKFGELMRVAWLPDTFGFGWQLPQILRGGGVEYFVTQKLRWNDSTQFPHGVFWWEGLDGTKIFSMMSGAIGESIESVKMASHAFDWQVKTNLQDALWLPGVGDHGGGPTRDMLEVAKRWNMSPFFPRMEFAKAVDYLSLIASQFLPEVAEIESQSDAAPQSSRASLKIPQVGETFSDVASRNLLENSTTLAEIASSTGENPASLQAGKVGETFSDVASRNKLKNSASLAEIASSTGENPASLEAGKVGETFSDVAAKNLLENSASLAEIASSTGENPASLQAGKVGETFSDVAAKNLLEKSASLAEIASSTGENPASLQAGKVGETLSDVASENLLEKSATLAASRTNQPLSLESLQAGKVGETLSDVAAKNKLEKSATLAEIASSTGENPASLQAGKVGETLSDVASRNLLEKSASLAEIASSTGENPASLQAGKVGETFSDVASGNLLEKSATLAESRRNQPLSRENWEVRKIAENLSALGGNFSGKISESEPECLDFPTNLKNEKSELPHSPTLPIWKDELYLEFHRGCYTTRADQKRQNRRCEELLYQAELLSSLATICTGAVYPKSELESAWKQVLFNQFHDILPGSAIAQVYTDANLAFAQADRTCRHILLQSLDAIASQISLPSPPQPDAQPILIFNTLNWSRSEVVALPLPDSTDSAWQIYDFSGQGLTSQIVKGDRLQPQSTLLFWANNLPAIGYRVFWLCRESAQTLDNVSASPETDKKTDLSKLTYGIAQKNTPCQETHFAAARMVLENELILAKIDAKTGSLSSLWDKVNNREVLNAAGGNQLQAFQDSDQYWDAWNIDPNYQKHPLPAPILKEISWLERGEVRQSLRVIMQIGKSEFCQDYIVEIGSPLLKIKTVADWQETHVLVKAAFGLNVEADFATCEIPGGAIARTTKPQTAAEKAKWEVPILHWVDISNDGFGVSLLNDCKYGCDIQPNQIRLTLLRGSTWPDEQADKGVSEFTCAVYPHAGNWQEADTVRRGYELNLPLLVKVLPKLEENCHKILPAVGKLLDLSAENLVLMAFKQSEDNPNLWILRCYECHGEEAKLELNSDLGLAISQPVDLLEQPVNSPQKSDNGKLFKISPWEIASFAVHL